MLRNSIFVLLILVSVSGTVGAMPAGDLYEATVPVADQSDEERRQALPRAMGQVLIKLTGDPAVTDKPGVKPLINEAQRYMQQYGYVDLEQDGTDQPALGLRATFDQRAVDNALQQAGISTWGRERPGTLVWLAVEDKQGLRLAGLEQASGYLEPLSREAKRRGLPLQLPLMDLEDTSSLRPEDVREGRTSAIQEASTRYPADVVLAVYLGGVGSGNVNARWTVLSQQAGSDGWSESGESLETVLATGIDRLADRLAQRYAPTAVAGSKPSRVSLTVNSINSLSDYARAQTYIAGLGNVGHIEVSEVRPGEVVFEVEALNGAAALDQTIALGSTLKAESGSNGGGRVYRLLP